MLDLVNDCFPGEADLQKLYATDLRLRNVWKRIAVVAAVLPEQDVGRCSRSIILL